MPALFRLEEVLKATGGKLLSDSANAIIKGVSIDSRTIKRGDIFIAIRGENFDGHDFVGRVLEKASAIVVSRKDVPVGSRCPVILVKDTVRALGDLAAFHRRRFNIPVVAITGSAGKTTTKEMAARVLATRFCILKNIANQNNLIGVPLTLLRLKSRHEIAVVELGTNLPGEIRRLTQITHPTVAILTNIGESHLEFLKSRAGVFKEKFELVRQMAARGVVIYNQDDVFLKAIGRKPLTQRLISCGTIKTARFYAEGIETNGNNQTHFFLNGKDPFTLRTSARHMVDNALAAIAVGQFFKIHHAGIRKILARFKPLDNRGSLYKVGPYKLIDDTYNSNPVSLRSAIGSIHQLPYRGRKIFVCGDMLELGPQTERLHREMGRRMAKADIDILLTVGKHSRWIAEQARSNKNISVCHCPDIPTAQNRLARYLTAGDMIFLKGSRGIHLERIVEFIKEKVNS